MKEDTILHSVPPSTFACSNLSTDIPIIHFYAVTQSPMNAPVSTQNLCIGFAKSESKGATNNHTHLLSAFPEMEKNIIASKGAWTFCTYNKLLDLRMISALAFLSDFQMTSGKYSPSSHAYFINWV